MSFVALSLYQMSSLFQVLSCCLFCEATINRILWGSPMRFLQWVSEFLSPLSFCPRQFNPHHFLLVPSVPPSSSFLDNDYCYLSYLSLVSLVLVWKKRLVYLQLGKTWNHLPVGSLGPSFSYKAWWRGDITEDSLPKIVFRETALMLSSHLVYIHWLTLVFFDSCGDDESFYWLFLEYL